jgi:membrane protein
VLDDPVTDDNRDGQREDRAPHQLIVPATVRVVRQSMRDDVLGLSAELAYRFFLSLFPFFIFLGALGSFIAAQLPIENPAEQAVELIGDALPEEATTLIQGQLENIIENQNPGLLSLGAILAIFFATGGSNAIIKALDRVYSVKENRPIWKTYPLAVLMTLLAGSALIAAFLLLVPLRIFGAEVAAFLGLAEESSTIITIVGGLLAFVLVVATAAYVYRVAPNIQLPLKSVLPGAVLFALAWAIGTAAFFVWVTQFGDYTTTFGAIAGVVIIMIWFYVSALIFLVAAEINEVLHELRAPADVENRRRESEEAEEDGSAEGRAAQRGEERSRPAQREEERDEEGAATA